MPEASLTEFADKLLSLMPVIMREMVRQHDDEVYLGKITPAQYIILSYLSAHDTVCMSDLAHAMGVTTAATTGIVERLVRYRYVERLTKPGDRRIIRIKLTHKGSGLVRKITRQRRKMIMATFGKLREAERREYLKILERVKDIVVQERGGN